MRLRQVSFLTILLLLTQAVTALAGYVVVSSPPGSEIPSVRIYNDALLSVGQVPITPTVKQALASPSGDKLILISNNVTAPVTFVSIVGGSVTGTPRILTLENRIPVRAELSATGEQLIVIVEDVPATMYVISLANESVASGGKVALSDVPKDFALSPDGQYGYFVGVNNSYFVMNMSTLQEVYKATGIGGPNAVSVSPTGRVFVTTPFQLLEYSPVAPFTRVGFTQVFSSPGKIVFSPDGRYLLAPNLALNNNVSLQIFDTNLPGGNLVGAPVTAGILGQISVSLGGQAMILPENLTVVSPTRAYARHADSGRMIQINYPVLSAAEAIAQGVGSFGSVPGFVTSNEYPSKRFLYYGQANLLRAYDIITDSLGNLVNTGPNVADLFYAATPSLGPATQLAALGAGQVVGPAAPLKPYAVRATDALGRPVVGASVTFSSPNPDVGFSITTAFTNIDGIATVTAVAPPQNGDFEVRAAVGSLTASFISRVTGGQGGGEGPGAGTPRIIKVRGDGALRNISDGLGIETNPMVVRLLDGEDKPIVGAPVTWTWSDFVGPVSPANTITDENGEARFLWVPGGTATIGAPLVSYQIVATSTVGTATFVATAFPIGNPETYPNVFLLNPTQENPRITARLGEPVPGAVRVQVLTGSGGVFSGSVPIPNVGIRVFSPFTNPADGPVATCQGGIVLTNALGVGVCDLVMSGRTGMTTLTVEVGGGYASFTRVEVEVLPGNPTTPTVVQGNRQTIFTGDTAPLALIARVRDAAGNDLQGVQATWEVVTPGTLVLFDTTATTNVNGQVSTRVRATDFPGTHQVRLRVGSLALVFEVIVQSRLGGAVIVSGNNQSGVIVGQPFPQPLVVSVTNTAGQPLANQVVNWAVTSGSATLSAPTSATGISGQAAISVTAGPNAGPITVTATIGTLPALVFNLSSRPPGPSVTAASFRNAASGEFGITPGGLVRITAPGLAPGITGVRNANLLAGRLPVEFEGVKVQFTTGAVSAWAPIYQVANVGGAESALIQVPFELLSSGTASVTVYVGAGNSAVTGIPVLPASPGVLEDDFGNGRIAAVVIRSDGLVVTPQTPARRGETLRMYAVGLGQTTPLAETNRVGVPGQKVKATVAVGIDNAGVEVVSATLAENLVGVYEIVFVVPATATFGNDRPLGFVMEVVPGQPLYANGSIIAIGPQ